MTNDQLIADLRATKDALRIRGRCRVSLTRTDGKVCLDGAVGVATIENFEELDNDIDDSEKAYRALNGSPRAMAVINSLASLVMDEKLNQGRKDTIRVALAHREPASMPNEIRAVWMYNDWTEATDQDCYNLIDKALAAEGGLL